MAVGTWQRGSTVCTYTTYTYDYRHCSNKLNVEHLPKCWTLPLKQQCLRLASAVACVQPLVSECTLLSCIVAAPSSVRSLRCLCVATSADPRWPTWLPLQPGWMVTAAGSEGEFTATPLWPHKPNSCLPYDVSPTLSHAEQHNNVCPSAAPHNNRSIVTKSFIYSANDKNVKS